MASISASLAAPKIGTEIQDGQPQPQNADHAQTQNSGPVDADDKQAEADRTTTPLDVLPAELLASILFHLGVSDLLRVAVTCTVLHAATTDGAVWQHRVRQDYSKSLLLAGNPTTADLDALDRTWKWFYQACTWHKPTDGSNGGSAKSGGGIDAASSRGGHSGDASGTYACDAPTLSAAAARYVSGVTTFGGDHGPGGTLDGPGVLATCDENGDCWWYMGRWTAGTLSGVCRIVHHTEGAIATRYEGEAVDCRHHGQGTQVDASGARYVGSWRDGLRSGQGAIYKSDGTPWYIGEWLDDMPHGCGCLYGDDGRSEGEFARGKLDGHAVVEWGHGRFVYSGLYRDNCRHGPGRLTTSDGTILDAVWDDGVIVGDVNVTMPGGAVYKGQWSGNGPHGIGSLTTPGGTVDTGRWYKSDPVGKHISHSHPACRGRSGHDHGGDARTAATSVMPHNRLIKLRLPNGDHMVFTCDDADDPANICGTLRYTVSNPHPTHGGCLFVCAGRHVRSGDGYRGFGVVHVDGPDATMIATLFTSGWTCYSESLLHVASPSSSSSSSTTATAVCADPVAHGVADRTDP